MNGNRLADIAMAEAGRGAGTPHVRELTELRFGRNETTERWLGDGWGMPEDAYVWAIGPASILRLPVLPDGAPRLALLDMQPFVRPPGLCLQRIGVSVDGGDAVVIELHERTTLAITLHPRAGETSVGVRFENFDAAFETSDPFYHCGKPFAWMLASVRIVPGLARYLPGARPRVPGRLADGSMQGAVEALTGLPVAEFLESFISLGNCCEIGGLQEEFESHRIGLLRYAAIRQSDLIEGLFTAFGGIGRLENLAVEDRQPGGATWRIIERKFSMTIATPYPNDRPFPAHGLASASRRLPRLAERLMEDVAVGQHIFVMRIAEAAPCDHAMSAVLGALRSRGDAELIALVNHGDAQPGTVWRLPGGLIYGRLESDPFRDLRRTSETALSVLANGFVMLRQTQRLPC